MRILSISAVVLFSISTSFASGTAASDPCRAKALAAAQADYGLDPFRCTISTIETGAIYKVYVGIGNAESGEDLYYVTFANGCSSDAVASEAPEVPINPLQADADAAYSKFLTFDTEIPASYEVSSSALPAKAQALYAEREKTLQSLISQWTQTDPTAKNLKLTVYKMEVDGQDTFAILFPNEQDSIREYLYIVDSKGNDVDQAAVYSDSSVGVNGVTWQQESVQK